MNYIIKLNKKFQLTLPPEIREALKLQPDDLFTLWLEGRTLVLKRKEPPTSFEEVRKRPRPEMLEQGSGSEEPDPLVHLGEVVEDREA